MVSKLCSELENAIEKTKAERVCPMGWRKGTSLQAYKGPRGQILTPVVNRDGGLCCVLWPGSRKTFCSARKGGTQSPGGGSRGHPQDLRTQSSSLITEPRLRNVVRYLVSCVIELPTSGFCWFCPCAVEFHHYLELWLSVKKRTT